MPYRQNMDRELDQPLAQRSVPSPKPFKQLVATSAKMCVLLEKLARVANSRATVLIEGESGTGKEV